MSTAVVPVVAPAAGLPEYRRDYLWREAQNIAIVNNVRADLRRKPEDVFAIACTLAVMGIEPTLYTVNQCFVVNGVVGLMGQLLIGVADQRGYDLDIVERTPERASVVLRRKSDGRETAITYTIEEAKTSAATSDVWKKYPADMLIWRAVRRAMRFGAPAIVAGLPADPDDAGTWEPQPELPDEPQLGDGYAALPSVDHAEKRTARLKRQVDALPKPHRDQLVAAWTERRLPPLVHADFPGRLDEAEDLVDEITARALASADESNPVRDRDVSPTHVRPPVAGQGPAQPQSAPSTDDRARPLAQQIAMQAQAAGVDHHDVIRAVTCGEKSSAKAVDAEEGELTLKAIYGIREGIYTLVERDGQWFLEEPPARRFPDPSQYDQGHPFE